MSQTTVAENPRDARAGALFNQRAWRRRMLGAAVSSMCIALGCSSPPEPAGAQQRWSNTGAMLAARAEHVAALLPSGQVLVAGGLDHVYGGIAPDGGPATEWTCHSSAEVYDPATGAWADTGSMLGPRCTRELYPISMGPYAGKVMVGGGIASYWVDGSGWFQYRLLATTELFDPANGTWAPGPEMLKHSVGFVQLADGKLLAVGSFVGDSEFLPTADVQILDVTAPEPAWRFVQPMNDPRAGPRLVLLDNGEVLAIGGLANRNFVDHVSHTAERYDPTTNQWRRAASPPEARWNPVAVRLPNGNVLFTAGCHDASGCDDPQSIGVPEPSAEAWIYEPARDIWRRTNPMNYPRAYALGTLLNSGKVLVASGIWKQIRDGGQVDYYPAPAPEIFDPTTESWTTTNPMPHYVGCCGVMVRLRSGDVLFSGGYVNMARPDQNSAIPGAQVFHEGP